MTDFSPFAVKAAARQALAQFDASPTNWGATVFKTEINHHKVEISWDGRGEIMLRVIDPSGRHWFPDPEPLKELRS